MRQIGRTHSTDVRCLRLAPNSFLTTGRLRSIDTFIGRCLEYGMSFRVARSAASDESASARTCESGPHQRLETFRVLVERASTIRLPSCSDPDTFAPRQRCPRLVPSTKRLTEQVARVPRKVTTLFCHCRRSRAAVALCHPERSIGRVPGRRLSNIPPMRTCFRQRRER